MRFETYSSLLVAISSGRRNSKSLDLVAKLQNYTKRKTLGAYWTDRWDEMFALAKCVRSRNIRFSCQSGTGDERSWIYDIAWIEMGEYGKSFGTMTYHDYGTESALSFSYCSLGENCFYLFHATIIRVIIFHYVFLQISRSHLSRNKAGYPRFYLYVLHPHDRDYGGQKHHLSSTSHSFRPINIPQLKVSMAIFLSHLSIVLTM